MCDENLKCIISKTVNSPLSFICSSQIHNLTFSDFLFLSKGELFVFLAPDVAELTYLVSHVVTSFDYFPTSRARLPDFIKVDELR